MPAKQEAVKTACSALFAAASVYFRSLALPITVLLAAMAADYITGVLQAYVNHTLSSKVGVIGIIKKLCYMFTVVCGIMIDYVCSSALAEIGVTRPGPCFFGTLVTVWLILNEVISILENLQRIGVPLPPFLTKIVEKLKCGTEAKSEKVRTDLPDCPQDKAPDGAEKNVGTGENGEDAGQNENDRNTRSA